MYKYIFIFSATFTKGNNFCNSLFACLEDIDLPNGVYPTGAKSFQTDSFEGGGKNKSDRVASPHVYPLILNATKHN